MAVAFLSDNTQCYSKSTIDMMTQKQELEEQSQLPIPEVVVCPECFTPDSSVTCAGYNAELRGYKKFKFVCHEYHFKPYKCACCGNVFIKTAHQKENNFIHPILWWLTAILALSTIGLIIFGIAAKSLIGLFAILTFGLGTICSVGCDETSYGFEKSDKITEDTLFQEMSNLFEDEFQYFEHSVTRDKPYIEARAQYVGEEQAKKEAEEIEEAEEGVEQEQKGETYSNLSETERYGGEVRQVEVPLHSTRLVEDADGSVTEVHDAVSASFSTVIQEPNCDVFAYDVTTGRTVKCPHPMPSLNDVDAKPADYGMQNNPVDEVNVFQLTIDTLRREGSD